MKLPPARVASFLAAPDPKLRAFLVYGPDAGLVRERADRLAKSACPDLADPFRVADLAAAALASDPARLDDEMRAQSLIGGRRVVRVRDAGDAATAQLSRLLADVPPGDTILVVEGGELATRSSLRRAFEDAAGAVAIACYPDGARELGELVREVLGERRIKVAPDAQQYLVSHLGGDRQVSRRELEKLALYAGDGGKVELEDAEAAVGDTAALTIDDIVEAVAAGDPPALERALFRAFAEGEQPVAILRALLRHFQQLHLLGSRIAQGMSEDEALRSLRPPLFPRAQDRVRRQLGLWPVRRAANALSILLEAESAAKRTGLPADTVCREASLRIARAAQPARARR